MAALLVAARLAWGMDGTGRQAPPDLPQPPSDWARWAAAKYGQLEGPLPSAIPVNTQQASGHPGSQQAYLAAA